MNSLHRVVAFLKSPATQSMNHRDWRYMPSSGSFPKLAVSNYKWDLMSQRNSIPTKIRINTKSWSLSYHGSTNRLRPIQSLQNSREKLAIISILGGFLLSLNLQTFSCNVLNHNNKHAYITYTIKHGRASQPSIIPQMWCQRSKWSSKSLKMRATIKIRTLTTHLSADMLCNSNHVRTSHAYQRWFHYTHNWWWVSLHRHKLVTT